MNIRSEKMKNLTLKINDWDWINQELDQFLNTQTGIIDSITNIKKNIIDIKYDSEKTNIIIIMKYIRLFLSIGNEPTMLEFNKHSQNELNEYTMKIEDLCCEYCMMGIIEELFEIDGIEEVNSDFDFDKRENINIFIKYNPTIIDNNKLTELEKKFNYID
jgi:copper chaperone CopZ